MNIMKIPSIKPQIPGPDRINAYSIYYLLLKSRHGWWLKPNKSRQGGLKWFDQLTTLSLAEGQIPMAQI